MYHVLKGYVSEGEWTLGEGDALRPWAGGGKTKEKEPNEVVIRLLTVFAAPSRRAVCGLIDVAQSGQRLVAQKR